MSAGAEIDVPREDLDALAGEFVLRVLSEPEEQACVLREARDPAFAAAADRWRRDLEELDTEFAPEAPGAAALSEIEARLFGVQPSLLRRLWGNVGLWRGVAAVAAISALWLAVPLAPSEPEGPEPRMVSALAPASAEGAAEYLAVYEPETATLSLTRVAGAPPSGQVFELWVIPDRAQPTPVSLGVLPETPLARMDVSSEAAPLLAAGALLALTNEPPGGGPEGRPTGEVRAAGPLRDI